MVTAVNAGARLDRLPVSSFHYRIFWLVGAGMFFDGYDLYVAGGVLASAAADQILDRPAKPAVHFADLCRHDAGRADHRLCRRPLRTSFHLSDQPADLWPGITRGGLCAGHDAADHLPLRARAWPRRRDRGRLFDADRVRAAADARTLAVDDGVSGGGGISGHRATRLSHHPGLRMAADVRHRGRRLADRLVPAQEPAGIAALARSAGPHRRSRSPDADDRKGSIRRQGAAGAARARRRCRWSRCPTCSSRRCCSASLSAAGC